MSEATVFVSGLRKVYGPVVAVDNLSFSVAPGEIFGLVGPNGAGKTTTIECLEGLRRPTAGTVRVLGLDPCHQGRALRPRIGVQLQTARLWNRLRVEEACRLFTALYPHTRPWEPLLERFGLADKRHTPFYRLSGGQQQRLFIVLALLHNPEVLFLDELTTGLDPQARHAMWDLIRDIRAEGKTILLTTHFMDEAERLCDRVAIIDHGRLVALDTPEGLITRYGGGLQVRFALAPGHDLPNLDALPGLTRWEAQDGWVTIWGNEARLAGQVVLALEQQGYPILDLHIRRPTLEDVFLALTGRSIRD